MVTSRPYIEIEDNFQAVTDPFPYIHLQGEEENSQIHGEISHVVKLSIAELSQSLKLPVGIRDQIEKRLLEMEHRTYLWLHLAIADIRIMVHKSLRPDDGELIRLIPSSVNDAYEKILCRVTQEKVGTVRKILQIIVAARRPLSTAEMAMALGVAD